MAQIVLPDIATPTAPVDAISEIARALVRYTGAVPSSSGLACVAGQSAAETWHWSERGFRCYSGGNVRASKDYHGCVTYRGCNERIRGKLVWYHPPEHRGWSQHDDWIQEHPDSVASDDGTRFRAYKTLRDGIDAWIAFLVRQYSTALEVALSRGDTERYAELLQATGPYFTARLSEYQRILRSTSRRYREICDTVAARLNTEEAPTVPCPATELIPLKPDWDEMAAETVRVVRNYDAD